MFKRLLKILVIFTIVLSVGWIYQIKNLQLSAIPPESSSISEFVTKPSSVSVNVRLPFNELSELANRNAPSEYSDSGFGKDVCKKFLLIKHCVGTKYSFRVSRGAIKITSGPNHSIRVSVPLTIKGHGGFRGDVPKWFKLDKKNFRASVEAFADIKIAMGPGWCPKLSVNADFRWIDKAEVEIVGGVWVDISGQVRGKLKDQIKNMGNAVASAINCDDIRKEVKKTWNSYSVPLEIEGIDTPLFVNFRPERFGFSGLSVTRDSADLSLSLTVKADVSGHPLQNLELDLPPLKNLSHGPGFLNVSIPVHLTYDCIKKELTSQLTDKPMSMDTPTGKASVVVKKLKVYPSNDFIVIGGLVDVDLPDRWLDVSGWVYLKSKPIPVKGGTGIKFAEIGFSRILENEVWNIVSVILENTIKKELEKNCVISLEDSITKAKIALTSELSKPHNGLLLNLSDLEIGLGRVGITAKQLFIEGLLRSRAEITFKAF